VLDGAVLPANCQASGTLPGEKADGSITDAAKSLRTHLELLGSVAGPIKSLDGKKMSGGGGPTPATVVVGVHPTDRRGPRAGGLLACAHASWWPS